jgi:MFS family permease
MSGTDAQTVAYYADKKLLRRNVFWFLFGSTAAPFGQSTVMALMPLHMSGIGMNAASIATLIALVGWVGAPLCMYLGNLSDRWQWRWGRRLPFVLFSLPMMVVGIVGFPFANSVVLATILFLLFQFAFQTKYAVYPYLMNDIAPSKFWGRISGIASAGSGIANWAGAVILMPMLRTRGEVFVYWICAGFVAVSTALTLLFVREPPARSAQPPCFQPFTALVTTLRLGLTSWFRFEVCVAFALANGINITAQLITLQARVNLNIPAADIGIQILQYGTIANMVLSYFAGHLLDRLGPARAFGFGLVLIGLGTICGFRPDAIAGFLGVQPRHVLATAWVLALSASAFAYLAAIVFQMKCVPRDEVATFCSCAGAMNLLLGPAFMFLTGQLITRVFGGNYGAAFLVSAAMIALAFLLYLRLGSRPAAADHSQLEPSPVAVPSAPGQ